MASQHFIAREAVLNCAAPARAYPCQYRTLCSSHTFTWHYCLTDLQLEQCSTSPVLSQLTLIALDCALQLNPLHDYVCPRLTVWQQL